MQHDDIVNEAPTICIVDDDEQIRASLVDFFQSISMRVEAFESATEFLMQARLSDPGCVLLDVHMPKVSGFDLQKRMADLRCLMPVVFMSGAGSVSMSVRAMKEGASDFIVKPFEKEQLLSAVKDAILLNADSRAAEAIIAPIKALAASLTPREREVMGYVANGSMNKQIAHELGVSEMMVKLHRARMMKKMQVRSLADLVKKLDLVKETETLHNPRV